MITLKEIIEEIQLANEGLIQTHPIETAINILDMWCNWNKIKYDKFNDNKIRAYIDGNITPLEFDVLLKYANNMGYIPSHIHDVVNGSRKYTMEDMNGVISKNIPFTLKLEAKYDIAVEMIYSNDIFYHASDEIHKNKILKMGLCPKSKQKIAAHPSRIYLTFRKEDAYLFAYNPLSQIKKWIVFEVDLSKMSRKIKLYNDPNLNERGCYTYDNIHPDCLTIL